MNYRVKALSVGGLGNKVFRYGDEVTEGNFPKARFAEILKGGFLEPIESKESKKIAAPVEEIAGDVNIDLGNVFESTEKKAKEEITAEVLRTYLDEKGVEYKKRAPKDELYSIYLLN